MTGTEGKREHRIPFDDHLKQKDTHSHHLSPSVLHQQCTEQREPSCMLTTPAGMLHHAKPQMEHRNERDARLLQGKAV